MQKMQVILGPASCAWRARPAGN